MANGIRQFNPDLPQRKSLSNSMDSLVESIKDRKIKENKESDALVLAKINVLSTHIKDKENKIFQYDEWLSGQGLYGELDEKYKTDASLSMMELLQGLEKDDYKGYATKLTDQLGELTTNLQQRKDIADEYRAGLGHAAKIEEEYVDLFEPDAGLGYEDYMITGVNPLDLSLEPGSEAEMIFNAKEMYDSRHQSALDLVLGEDVDNIVAGLSDFNTMFDTDFKNASDLELHINKLQALSDESTDPSLEWLKERDSLTDSYKMGVVAGMTTEEKARIKETNFINNQNAALARMEEDYQIEMNFLNDNADMLGSTIFSSIKFLHKNVVYDVDELAALNKSVNEEDNKVFNTIARNLNKNAPFFVTYLEGIIEERAVESANAGEGLEYDVALQMGHDLYRAHTMQKVAITRMKEQNVNILNQSDIDVYVQNNPNNPESQIYAENARFIADLRGVGISKETIGGDNLKMIADNFTKRIEATDNFEKQMLNRTGISYDHIGLDVGERVDPGMDWSLMDMMFEDTTLSEGGQNQLLGEGLAFSSDASAEFDPSAMPSGPGGFSNPDLKFNLTKEDRYFFNASQGWGTDAWTAGDGFGADPRLQEGKWDEFAQLIFDPGNFKDGELVHGTYLERMINRAMEGGQGKSGLGGFVRYSTGIGGHSRIEIFKNKMDQYAKLAKLISGDLPHRFKRKGLDKQYVANQMTMLVEDIKFLMTTISEKAYKDRNRSNAPVTVGTDVY